MCFSLKILSEGFDVQTFVRLIQFLGKIIVNCLVLMSVGKFELLCMFI